MALRDKACRLRGRRRVCARVFVFFADSDCISRTALGTWSSLLRLISRVSWTTRSAESVFDDSLLECERKNALPYRGGTTRVSRRKREDTDFLRGAEEGSEVYSQIRPVAQLALRHLRLYT